MFQWIYNWIWPPDNTTLITKELILHTGLMMTLGHPWGSILLILRWKPVYYLCKIINYF